MKVKCSKCNTIISVPEDKLPKNKLKAMVKCTNCQHPIVFTIPTGLLQAQPDGDKTEIGDIGGFKISTAKLIEKNTGIVHTLKNGNNVVGRDADISIDNDKYISRKHCLIEIKQTPIGLEVIISDDGTETGKPSTNGTFYKEQRISKYDKILLKNNDIIKIGRTYLTVKID